MRNDNPHMLRPDTFALTALLSLLTALGPLAVDMYLPSFPDIGRLLNTSPATVQLTLSLYLVAYAAPVFLLPLCYPLGGWNPVSGTARYLLDVAVIFVVLGRALQRWWAERSYVIIALTLQVGLLIMYLRGDWTF